MSKDWKGILVTGCPRSGTTWVGSVIARAPRLAYIHEPFNYAEGAAYCPAHFPHQYLRVSKQNADVYGPALRQTVGFYFGLRTALGRVFRRSPRESLVVDIGLTLMRAFRMKVHQFSGYWRPLVKDPIALLSSDWLAEELGLRPLVLVRHPGGFVSRALRNPEFLTPLTEFPLQDELLRGLLSAYVPKKSLSALEHASLQWLMLNRVVLHFQESHPEWVFLRYEELALEPLDGFTRLFQMLGLELTPKVKKAVTYFSSSTYSSDPRLPWDLRRNSPETCYRWQDILSPGQRQEIWEITGEVAGKWYRADGSLLSLEGQTGHL